MIYLNTKFHLPSCNRSSLIAVKLKCKHFRTAAMTLPYENLRDFPHIRGTVGDIGPTTGSINQVFCYCTILLCTSLYRKELTSVSVPDEAQ